MLYIGATSALIKCPVIGKITLSGFRGHGQNLSLRTYIRAHISMYQKHYELAENLATQVAKPTMTNAAAKSC